VRRLDTRHGNRCRDGRGENSTNSFSAIWRFPMLWKTDVGTWRFRKNSLFSRTCRREPPCSLPLPISLYSHSASNSEHKLDTRDQKSWREKTAPRFTTIQAVSVSLTRDSTSLPIFRRITWNFSTLL